jgi:hypothetical protein
MNITFLTLNTNLPGHGSLVEKSGDTEFILKHFQVGVFAFSLSFYIYIYIYICIYIYEYIYMCVVVGEVTVTPLQSYITSYFLE